MALRFAEQRHVTLYHTNFISQFRILWKKQTLYQ